MFESETEIQRKFCGRQDIADAQAGGGAGCFLVDVGAVAIVDGVAGSIEFLDVGIAEDVTREGFDVPSVAFVVEKMAIADEEGDKDQVGLSRREILETGFEADFVAFCDGDATVEESSETSRGLAFHDQLGDFELCAEGGCNQDCKRRKG